ncbi:hypothetical protein [Nioella nitratireducens]|uniref:hypothetical protein n=1 Tax=Nioella nitratireducens TaxID=1287720 RepID=UPI0011BAA845|nr:hypothetical protein [Nioella nitratireducens]
MLDHVLLQEAEWDRSINKSHAIIYDKSSMPVQNAQFERLLNTVFERSCIENMVSSKVDAKKETETNTLKKCLKSILWHLYRAFTLDQDCYVQISLSSNSYKVKDALNPHRIPRRIVDIVHRLHDVRIIEMKIGFLDRDISYGRQTRIRATINFLKELNALPQNIKADPVPPPAILFRDKETKKPISSNLHMQSGNVAEVAELLTSYNDMMLGSRITLEGVSGDLVAWENSKGNFETIDLSKKFLSAVVHCADQKLSYFRMHSAFWQGMPSGYRHLVRVDGEKSVCLDYSSQVLNIAASLNKFQLPEDAYNIDLGTPFLNQIDTKNLIKSAVVIFLNTPDKKSGYYALRSALRKTYNGDGFPVRLTNEFFDQVVAQLVYHYPFLEQYLLRSHGHDFFAEDADVARNIIRVFLEKDKVVLPIHDGFMVAVSDRDFLHETMHNVWRDKFGTTIQIKEE